MKPEIPFVLGFAFTPSIGSVLLIEKQHGPSFNIGKWNGIGGKIEPGESARGAMAREFKEECGIHTESEHWYCFHIEAHRARREQTLNPRIYCLTTVLSINQFESFWSATDEMVKPFLVDDMGLRHGGVYNLAYLLEMAKCWHRHPEHQWLEG